MTDGRTEYGEKLALDRSRTGSETDGDRVWCRAPSCDRDRVTVLEEGALGPVDQRDGLGAVP